MVFLEYSFAPTKPLPREIASSKIRRLTQVFCDFGDVVGGWAWVDGVVRSHTLALAAITRRGSLLGTGGHPGSLSVVVAVSVRSLPVDDVADLGDGVVLLLGGEDYCYLVGLVALRTGSLKDVGNSQRKLAVLLDATLIDEGASGSCDHVLCKFVLPVFYDHVGVIKALGGELPHLNQILPESSNL